MQTYRFLIVGGVLAAALTFGRESTAFSDEPPSAVGPLIKLFTSGRLPAERQGTVVEMICSRGNEHDLRIVFDRVVAEDGFPPELRRKAMTWLTDAALTRKVKPAGNLSAFEQLVVGEQAGRDAALQGSAIRLAAAWKDAAVSGALQKLATSAETKPELQRIAIEGLIAIGDPGSRKTIAGLTAESQPMRVRMLAVAGLTGFDLEESARAGAAILAVATSKDDPSEMLGAFLNRKGGAEKLAAALAKQSISVDVAKVCLRYMYSVGHSDASLSDVLTKAVGIMANAPPPTPEEVAKIVAEVTAKGDPVRGERVFRRKDLSCMKCHSVSRAGGQVGPELSAVGGSSPTDYIVNSILNPNLAVKEQFVTRVFELNSGMVLTGIVIDRDDVRVRIRDVNGQTVTVPTADVDSEEEGPSLMPKGLVMFMTHDELVDLARFVSDLGKPGPFAVQTAKRIQRWRVMRELPPEIATDVPHLENLRQFVLGAAPESWLPAYAKVNGALPLEELRKTASTSEKATHVVMLQGEFTVSSSDRINVKVESTENFQIWIDADAFENRKQIEITPQNGRHTVTIRVEISDGESPELRVEFSTPDGSSANYEMVGGS